jgi:hypothetical protein
LHQLSTAIEASESGPTSFRLSRAIWQCCFAVGC